MHYPHAMHCVPSTATAAIVCRDMTTMSETKTNDKMQKTKDTMCERVHAAHACSSRAASTLTPAALTHKHAARELEVDPRHSTAAQSTATAHAIPRAAGTAAGTIIDIVSAAAAEACLAYRPTAKPCCVDALYQSWAFGGVVSALRAGDARGCRGNERAVWKHFSRAASSGVVSRAFIWVSRSVRS